MIWRYIGTAAGLSPWFADRVECFDRTYDFIWGKTEKRTAHLVSQRNGVYVKFRWDDEPQSTFFEMRISYKKPCGSFGINCAKLLEQSGSTLCFKPFAEFFTQAKVCRLLRELNIINK